MNQRELLNLARMKAKEDGVNPQVIHQRFFLEELLTMMLSSDMANQFVLKGGFLVEKIIGDNKRATQDIDMMLKNFDMEEEQVKIYFNNLLENKSPNGVEFRLTNLVPQHQENGMKVFFQVQFGRMSAENLHLDLSTNNLIHPEITTRTFTKLDGSTYEMQTFPLEQVIADKLVATIKKGERNNRDKDYYDLFMFDHLDVKIDSLALKKGFLDTLDNEVKEIVSFSEILRILSDSTLRQESWKKYQMKNPNAKSIEYQETIRSIFQYLNKMGLLSV